MANVLIEYVKRVPNPDHDPGKGPKGNPKTIPDPRSRYKRMGKNRYAFVPDPQYGGRKVTTVLEEDAKWFLDQEGMFAIPKDIVSGQFADEFVQAFSKNPEKFLEVLIPVLTAFFVEKDDGKKKEAKNG